MTLFDTSANASAVISDDGLYRYRLTREVGCCDRTMTFVMLNPSTADALTDDPTIRRCKNFAAREGCHRIIVVNLYAYRATKPTVLREAAGAGIDPVGPENLRHVDMAMREGRVVVAWGAHAATSPATSVAHLIANWSGPMWCLGRTKDGSPRHPLMVRSDQPLERWTPLQGVDS